MEEQPVYGVIDINIYDYLHTPKNLAILQENLEKLEILESKIEENNLINRTAIVTTVKQFQEDIGLKYLMENAKRAVEFTKEYDYPPYKSHLLEAIQTSVNITVSVNEETLQVSNITIDMRNLGNIENWLGIIEQVRQENGWTDLRGRTLKPKEGEDRSIQEEEGIINESLSARFWRAKYYAAGREGKKIQELRVTKRKTKTQKRETKVIDVTQKYVKGYKKAMRDRMSRLASGFAPYWQFVDQGNVELAGEDSPYPMYGPTHFVDMTERALLESFKQALDSNKVKVQEEYDRLVSESVGLRGITGSVKKLIELSGDRQVDFLIGERDDIDLRAMDINAVIRSVEKDNKLYDIIKTSSGRAGLRFNIAQWSLTHRGSEE